MGFVRQKTYVLDFEGTELDGLTVKAKACTVGEYVEIHKVYDRELAELDSLRNDFGELAELIVPHLIEWDLEEPSGQPIPLTLESVTALDHDALKLLLWAYRTAITEVPRPLEKPSASGEPSQVELPPMEVLSPSLAS